MAIEGAAGLPVEALVIGAIVAADWLVCVAIGSSVLWAEEIRKWLARRGAAAG